MRILTAEQMREADRHAIERLGIPSADLMENAGAAVVAVLERAHAAEIDRGVVILCGTGNNGGDGMVVARLLASRGHEVALRLVGDESRLSPDAARQWKRLARSSAEAAPCGEDDWDPGLLDEAGLVVDALLGTGFRGTLDGLLARVVADVNACGAPVVSVDVPSGLSGSSCAIEGPAIRADLTVVIQSLKICHAFPPASDACGRLVVANIGIPEESLASAGAGLSSIDDEDVAPLLLPLAHRATDTHKGDFGHVLVAGGALTHPGAPALAGLGALRGGAGLVTVAAPLPCLPIVAGHAPELMHEPLPADAEGRVAATRELGDILARKDAVVAGPGLGQGHGAAIVLRALLEQGSVPMVLDADALNLIAREGLPAPRPERPLVLTPHPGELARLAEAIGEPCGDSQLERLPAARALAKRLDAVVVVKGARTLVVEAEGEVGVLLDGNPGMATGGTGDVLAGLIGALLAQGLPPREAATAAVLLHGRAGDLAAEELGQMSMLATDVLRFLPEAVRSILEPPGIEDDDDEADEDRG